MSFTIKATMTVRKLKIKEAAFSRQLSAVPQVRSSMLGIASKVVQTAQADLDHLGLSPGRGLPTPQPRYPAHRGTHFSLDPIAVSDQISVKDIRDFNTPTKSVGRVAPVALVVADHPMSRPWEFGLDGLPQVNYLSHALDAAAASSPRLSRRPGQRSP